MDHFGEQSRFEVRPVIEQRPFESPAVQSFFTKWCEINDSIEPQMIDRDDWKQRGAKGILEERPDGKQTLYIPEDLQLWEMVGVMEVMDYDTFATKPERQDEAKKKLLELGETFENAGIYIAQRLDSIDQGKDIARALAEEFYGYGQSLTSGEKSEKQQTIDDIASHNLTASELDAVDRFLAGDNLYQSRQAKAEKVAAGDPSQKDKFYETERQKTLSQFFKVSEKAFALERKSESGELQANKVHLKPWQNDAPLHSAFLAKIEKAMAQKIEMPKREFETAIFRRGLEKLVGEMKESGWKHGVNTLFKKLGIDLRVEQRKIADSLNIDGLKAELDAVRQTGDITRISAKERKVADKIQKAVSGFPQQLGANNPSEMVANQYINCVGASTLGGALMREAELNYLVGDIPEHSILFLVTSDGHVEWRDMLGASFNENLTDEMIEGRNKDGSPLTVADIATFSKNPTPEGLMFDIKSEKYRDKFHWVKKRQRQYVTVFEPEYGQQIQILNNTGSVFYNLGRNEEAIEAYRQAVALDPKDAYPYYGLGRSEKAVGNLETDPKIKRERYQKAIEAYRQAVAVDSMYADPYYGLGNALSDLGRKEEAIEAYQKFIDLADKQKDDYWIKRAKGLITELQNK